MCLAYCCFPARKAVVAFAAALLAFVLPSAVAGDSIDFASLHMKRGANGPTLSDAAGRRVAHFEMPQASQSAREAIGAEIVGNTLELDLRGAFSAGANQARLRIAVPDPERFAGKSVSFAVTACAPDATQAPSVRAMPCGAAGSRYWRPTWDSIAARWKIPPVPTLLETSAPVPPDTTELFLDLTFLAPGDGKIVLSDFRYGDFTILSEEPDAGAMPAETSTPSPLRGSAAFWFDVPDSSRAQRTLFSLVASLTNSALGAARSTPPGGSAATPLSEGGMQKNGGFTAIPLSDGGMLKSGGFTATPLSEGGKTGETPPSERGDATEGQGGVLRAAETPPPSETRHSQVPVPGDAALSLDLDGRRLVWKRNDLLGEGSGRTPEISDPGRHHCIFSWDERGCTITLDGNPFPSRSIDLDHSPIRAVLGRRLPLAFREGAANRPFRAISGDGVSGLRLFSGPMDWMRAKEAYLAFGGTPRPDYNGWTTPWRAPSDPPPPNPALLPPGKQMDMRLLEDVSPAALARSGDVSRFRSTGTWRVGTLDGLDYLDAGEGLYDRFAIRFQVDPSIGLLCFEVTYPDDRARSIDLIASNSQKRWDDYAFNAGIETGLEHPVSGRNAVKRFLYWPKRCTGSTPGDLALVAMTNGEGEPAAISRIRLYEVVGAALPPAPQRLAKPVEGHVRRFALRFEDISIGCCFGCGNGPDRNATLGIDRIASYMKFIGADTLVTPGVFYDGPIGNGAFDYNPRRYPPHYLREVCRRFGRDGLSLYASINQERFPDIPAHLSLRSLTDGSLHGSPIAILADGYPNWGKWHFTPTYYNISHPDVQKALLDEIDVLLEECVAEPAFKGVCLDLFNSINVGWWGSAEAGYNDYSIAAFEKTTGLRVAPETDRSDPSRGRAYHDWLRANAWDKWLDWRCDVVADFYARIAERLRSRRPDLELWVSASPPWRPDLANRPDLRDPDIIEKTLREAGIDAQKLAAIPNLAFGELSMPCWWRDELRKTSHCPEGSREYVRDLPETPGMYAAARKTRYPLATLHDSYYETDIGGPVVRNQWGRKGDGRLEGDWLNEPDWRVTAFNASGREALRPYAMALAHGDLFAFARGGFLIGTSGTEDVLRPFVANFRALPAVVFQDVALPSGAPAAARLRKAVVNGVTWYYALNPGYEPCQIALPEPLVDALTGKPVPSTLPLDGYELKALRIP